MKIRLSIFLVFFVCSFFLPIPLPLLGYAGYTGMYNTVSGLIWCTSEKSCIHEVAHKLDDEGGWISETPEFERDVELLLGSDLERGFMNKHIHEIYANLFAMAKGKEENMPELLRPYYDWERAAELMKKYER